MAELGQGTVLIRLVNVVVGLAVRGLWPKEGRGKKEIGGRAPEASEMVLVG